MGKHYPHGNQHRRKLKDYFFEFFMLFLAVTAGFFMENMRESYIDNHKENQYISSLIRDVQEDTAEISEVVKASEFQIKGIDSLIILLENPVQEINTSKLYYFVNRYLSTLKGFSVREVTITQLRNSAGLRLIDNNSVSDSIVIYYGTYDSHVDQQNYNYKIFQELTELEMEILDFSAYRITGKEMTIDMSHIKEFYNRILVFNSMLSNEANWLKNYQKKGDVLLRLLKQEYKVE